MRRRSSRPPTRRSSLPKVYDDPQDVTETDPTLVVAPKSFRTTRNPTLMAMAGSLAGNVFRLRSDRVSIGRGKKADITLPDGGVSRIHCIVHCDAMGRWFVEDQSSTNGTIVNGAPVARVALSPGDRIQVGSEAVLQFGYFDEAEEELARRMYEGATRDPLTRAFNRRHSFERLGAEVSYATRHDDGLVAVMFDLDHFKRINDTHGHACGDAVLRQLGATVGGLLRNEDIFARYGGEEFVVLARGLALEGGAKLAERIRTIVAAHEIGFEAKRVQVTVSAGVAALAEVKDARAGEGLMTLADTRLYQAKAKGRNCVVAG